MSDLVRSAQIFSCSIAAARNVSPAASMTLRPAPESLAASLPMVVVLPVPLTPTTRMTCGLWRKIELQRLGDGGQHLGDLGRHDAGDLLAGHVLAVALGGQRVGDAERRLDAEIGLDQEVFEVLQRLVVELALGEERRDLAGELRRGAGETLAQALEPAEFLLRGFRLRLRRRGPRRSPWGGRVRRSVRVLHLRRVRHPPLPCRASPPQRGRSSVVRSRLAHQRPALRTHPLLSAPPTSPPQGGRLSPGLPRLLHRGHFACGEFASASG